MIIKYFLVAYVGAFIASLNSMTGQALTNRPVVLGPLVGLILGDLRQGVIIGSSLELAYMGVMVIGVSSSVNMTVASLLGTTYAIVTGQGSELAIALAVPCSLLSSLVGRAIGPINLLLQRQGIKAADSGDARKVEFWHYFLWVKNILVNGTVYFLGLVLGAEAVQAIIDKAPTVIINGLRAGSNLVPALGFAMLFNLCWTKEVTAFFIIGYVFAVYLKLDNLGVALLAAAFALIAFFFIKDENEDDLGLEEVEEETVPVERKLDLATLKKVYWRSYQLEADFTSERYQGLGFCFSVIPAIEKLYDTEEERKEAIARQAAFFNTTPTIVTLITGIALAMEEEKSVSKNIPGGVVSSIKVALMGPAAGIGDAIFWGSYRILCASVACQMGVNGNLLAPLVFLFLFNLPNVLIHYYGLLKTYEMGSTAVRKLYESGLMDKITLCCSIMGMTMIGAMTASMIGLTTKLQFTVGETTFVLQELLDSILPEMLSLAEMLILARVLKKEIDITKLMYILMFAGIAGAFLGVF